MGGLFMNPGRGRKPLGSAPEWMDHAESDLRLAQLAAGDPSIRAEQICFHAQQTADKAIKLNWQCVQIVPNAIPPRGRVLPCPQVDHFGLAQGHPLHHFGQA